MNFYAGSMISLLMIIIFLFGCGEKPNTEHSTPVDISILRQWDGDYPVEAIEKLPAKQRDLPVGYFSDQESFNKVWTGFKPDEELPEVNFDENMVVYYRNITYYNRTAIFKVTLNEGVLEVLARETMSAMPIEEKAAMSMVVIPRTGIKFIRSGDQKIEVQID